MYVRMGETACTSCHAGACTVRMDQCAQCAKIEHADVHQEPPAFDASTAVTAVSSSRLYRFRCGGHTSDGGHIWQVAQV